MALLRCIVLVALALCLNPARAQPFVDDALRPLFHAVLLAQEVRDACAEADPELATRLTDGVAHLRDAHAGDFAAARAAAQRRAGPQGLEGLAKTLGTRFGERLQRTDAAGRRVECGTLVTYLETNAGRSRHELVEPSFRKWFAHEQQERHIACGGLGDVTRTLARRLLAGEDMRADQLRADAKMAERAAGWCFDIQAVAERERIHVDGNFGLIRDTAHAISDAVMPQLARDPGRARVQGRAAARAYLAEPDWL